MRWCMMWPALLSLLVAAEECRVAFVLRGYDNNPMFTSTAQFDSEANRACAVLSKLSFRDFSYEIFDAGVDRRSPYYMASLREIAVLEAALNNWPSPEWDWMRHNTPNWLVPDSAQRTLIQDAIDWMTLHKQTSQQWAAQTEQGKLHFRELQANVLRFSSGASSDYLKGMVLPPALNLDDYDTVNIILHSNTDYGLAGASSNLKQFGIGNSGKSAAYIGYNPSIVAADKGFGIIIHETIHSFGMGTHDMDPDRVSPGYSVMNHSTNFDTLPAFDRMHWLGWLPKTTITRNPSEVQDLKGAVDPDAKYLLKVGRRTYQELYDGKWIQYRTDSYGTVTFEQVDDSLRKPRKVTVVNDFYQGWNLVSLPFKQVLNGKVFVWNSVNGVYRLTDEIEANQAYWKFSDSDYSVSYEGLIPVGLSLDIKTGWNMSGIGVDTDVDDRNIFGWNSGHYYTPSVLKAGRGYWFFSPRPTTLIFD